MSNHAIDDYCCQVDRHLHQLLDQALAEQPTSYQPPSFSYIVHIGEAEKHHDNSTTFIAYTIQFGDQEVKRRYSEFESLRQCLCRLYPTFIIPPIPEKHSLTQYAVLQKRAKEDQYIIERRKRMLERFLNHLVVHPILSSEHVFHRFMEGGVSWTEVLHSPVIKNLPRTPLHSSPSRAPGSSVAEGNGSGVHSHMPKIAATNEQASDVPVPSALAPIKNMEPRWMDCELFTSKYANHFTGTVERSERRIYRKLGELSGDYAELGATLNGFSLLDHPDGLAAAIENVGQAVDNSYIEINQLLRQMEAEVSEPIHTYSQYSQVIKQVLRFRMLKNMQMEWAQESLAKQRTKLEGLLQADDEAKRLANAMDPPSTVQSSPTPVVDTSVHPPPPPHSYAAAVKEPETSNEFAPTLSEQPPQRKKKKNKKKKQNRRRLSNEGVADAPPKKEPEEEEDDDPLAKFQMEESQMWGGGTQSTLPRLRSRSKLRGGTDRRRKSGSIAATISSHEHVSEEEEDEQEQEQQVQEQQVEVFAQQRPIPPSTSNNLGTRLLRTPKTLGDGIMNRLTYALNGMMDVDPEQLRRNQIGRASDKINVLEEQLEMLNNDLVLINSSTQDNLDRFQKQKVRDLKACLVGMAKLHLEWAEKNLEIWREAKESVNQV